MDTYETRRCRLNQLVIRYGKQRVLADAVGIAPDLISRMLKDKKMGEDMRMKIEAACGLPRGWMDTLQDDANPLPATAPGPDFIPIARAMLKVSAGITGFRVEHLEGNGPPVFFRADWHHPLLNKPAFARAFIFSKIFTCGYLLIVYPWVIFLHQPYRWSPPMRTQAEIFTRYHAQMLAGARAIRAQRAAPATEPAPIIGRNRANAAPYGVGIRLTAGKYNPFAATIHRDGRAIQIGSFPTLAAAQQGQRDAYAGIALHTGTKAGRIV